jgi:hypothetical protein
MARTQDDVDMDERRQCEALDPTQRVIDCSDLADALIAQSLQTGPSAYPPAHQWMAGLESALHLLCDGFGTEKRVGEMVVVFWGIDVDGRKWEVALTGAPNAVVGQDLTRR